MIDAVLRGCWPGETQTLLLTAAIGAPAEASAAWQEWLSRRNLDEVRWPEVRLLATVARRAAQFEMRQLLKRISGYPTVRLDPHANVPRQEPFFACRFGRRTAAADVDQGRRTVGVGTGVRRIASSTMSISWCISSIGVTRWTWFIAQDGAGGSDLEDKSLGLDIFPHHHSVIFAGPAPAICAARSTCIVSHRSCAAIWVMTMACGHARCRLRCKASVSGCHLQPTVSS